MSERQYRDKQWIIMTTAAAVSVMVALIYAYVCYFMVAPDGLLSSDVKTQIGYMETWYSTGSLPDMCQAYPLFYYIVRFLYSVMHDWVAVMMCFCLVCVWLSNFLQIVLIRMFCGPKGGMYSILAGSALSLVWPVSSRYSFLAGTNYGEMLLEGVLLTSGSANPTHSLTYLLVKPFALIVLCSFICILSADRYRRVLALTLVFAAALFFSVLAKPCFYQAFAPAGVVVTVLYFLRERNRNSFMRALTIALGYLPATIWVLYAMRYKLEPYEVSLFEAIRIYGDGTFIPIVLTRSILYCMVVCGCIIVFIRRLDYMALSGSLIYVFGAAEFLVFIETQERERLSMAWGLYASIYAFFVTSIISLYRMRAMARDDVVVAKNSSQSVIRIMYPVCNILLAVHAAFGLAVFIINVTPWWISKLGI